MAKLGTRYREMKAHTLKLLEELSDKIESEEVELIEINREAITEGGANPGDGMMDYSHTGECILKIRYMDLQAKSKHETKTASWMPSSRQVMNR